MDNAPTNQRWLPSISPVTVDLFSVPDPPDDFPSVFDEVRRAEEDLLSLDPERDPCQSWHEYPDPKTGKIRKTLWPCGDIHDCSRCIDLRVQSLLDRFDRAMATYGLLAISVLHKADAARHLRHAKKSKEEYYKYPLLRNRVLLFETIDDAMDDATTVGSLEQLEEAVLRQSYHDLRTAVRLTPRRRRTSGALGKEVEEDREDDEGLEGEGEDTDTDFDEPKSITVDVPTVSLWEPNQPDTLEGHAKTKQRRTKKADAWAAAVKMTEHLNPQSLSEAKEACRLRRDAYYVHLVAAGIKCHKGTQKVKVERHIKYNWGETQCALNDAPDVPTETDLPKKVVPAAPVAPQGVPWEHFTA